MKDLLLASKPVEAFTPEEFKTYISDLHEEPEAKVEISARTNDKGTLIITTRRKPKWITRAEIEKLSILVQKPINDVWNHCKEKKFLIVGSPAEGASISKETKELDNVWPGSEEEAEEET